MKRLAIALLATLITLPALAQDQHQSYITYDDGDSVLLQNDGREIDARLNLPVYPGDELRTGKRGRTEVRLADGNVVSIDRYSRLRFESLLGTFEGEDTQTVARLLDGQVILYRLRGGSEALRLDTANASYLASKKSLYSVETNSRGVDVVTVFEGSIEVRTRRGIVAMSGGERAKVDLTGIYSRSQLVSSGASEFEQWFIRRASRYSAGEGRYLDSSLSYVETELSENGRWVYVSEYSTHVWRPYVSVGWRPYQQGYWHVGWGGTMTWVSYEPWGWVPYHYGRWAHHPYHGWVWLPGYGYSPAWVYWAWGPSWVGWAPAGWYDCYWGYRNWHYYPSYDCHNCGYRRGYGFNGRITIASNDLRAYTVVDRKGLFSNRIDRASLTADEVRNRLARDGNRGVLSNQTVRVNKDEMRDPSRVADRIIRGSNGSGTGNGQGAGSPADVTQFFQRDPNPSASVRDRVTRGVTRDTQTTQTTRGTAGGGVTVPGSSEPGVVTRGTTGRTGGAAGGTVTRGGTGQTVTRPTPSTGTRSDGGAAGSGTRGTVPRDGAVRPRNDNTNPTPATRSGEGTDTARPRTVTRPAPAKPTPDTSGSSGTVRPRPVAPSAPAKPAETKPAPGKEEDTGTRTRSRPSTRDADKPATRAPVKNDSASANDDWRRGSAGSNDPAQRVITTIGGARISSSGSGRTSETPSRTTKSNDATSGSWRSRGSFTSGNDSSTRSSSGTPSRGSSSVSRPSTNSGSRSGSETNATRSGSTKSGSTPSTRSSGSSSSSGGRAGVSRPSRSSGGSKSSASSGGSKSSGAKSSSSSSSSKSSSGKVTRKPD